MRIWPRSRSTPSEYLPRMRPLSVIETLNRVAALPSAFSTLEPNGTDERLKLSLLDLELFVDSKTQKPVAGGRDNLTVSVHVKTSGPRVRWRTGWTFDNQEPVALQCHIKRVRGSDNRPLRKIRSEAGDHYADADLNRVGAATARAWRAAKADRAEGLRRKQRPAGLETERVAHWPRCCLPRAPKWSRPTCRTRPFEAPIQAT